MTNDDAGSALITAMIVMLVLTSVTVATLARTFATTDFIRDGQNFDAALASADAGLSLAVYRIENGATTSWEEAGSAGSGTFRFYAQAVGQNEFIVSSKGRVGASMHALQAKVTRDALYPFALFGFESTTVNGTTGNNATSAYVVGLPDATVDIGSNAVITCNGPSASNTRYKSAGGFSGCPSAQWTKLEPKQARITLEPPPSPSVSCPSGGAFGSSVVGGIIDGHNGVPYVCRQDVVFSGPITVVNPPLRVYVLNSLNADGTVNPDACHTLDFGDALVNVGQPAKNVQLFKEDDCDLDVGNGNTASSITFSGVLYAPDSVVAVNGGKWVTGSWMVGQVTVNGGPNFVIGYDNDLRTYYGDKWQVSRYGEVPSSSITFPSGRQP